MKVEKYQPILNLIETEEAIKLVKDSFQKNLAKNLNLIRVTAPLFVLETSGLNDDLTGTEEPVKFSVRTESVPLTIVHSLAKWKRMALDKYNLGVGEGLYTDMNAIRKDEVLDNLHSLYVDQWDWERVITKDDRNYDFLKKIVIQIYEAIKSTSKMISEYFLDLTDYFPENIHFITTSELAEMYPNLSADEREYEVTKKYKSVFLIAIGDELDNGEKPHGSRAPDYDDWQLNGDIIVYYPPLDMAVELSSMGIRVDKNSLQEQLKKKNALDKLKYEYHQKIMNDELPLTIGGGIGQSRLCLIMLNKIHIGEVQASYWDQKNTEYAKKNNFKLL